MDMLVLLWIGYIKVLGFENFLLLDEVFIIMVEILSKVFVVIFWSKRCSSKVDDGFISIFEDDFEDLIEIINLELIKLDWEIVNFVVNGFIDVLVILQMLDVNIENVLSGNWLVSIILNGLILSGNMLQVLKMELILLEDVVNFNEQNLQLMSIFSQIIGNLFVGSYLDDVKFNLILLNGEFMFQLLSFKR